MFDVKKEIRMMKILYFLYDVIRQKSLEGNVYTKNLYKGADKAAL